MKSFMTCVAALAWIGLVIWEMDTDTREWRAKIIREREAQNRALLSMESLRG